MRNSTKESIYCRPTTPHFFQPLLPDFLSNFSIPNSFQKYLERSVDPLDEDHKSNKMAILRDGGQKCWEVKVENDSRRLKFKEGWQKYCKDNELKIGDFLVFRHHGCFIFDVFIFGPNACDRQLHSSNNIHHQRNEWIGARDDKSRRNLKQSGHPPKCRMTVKPYWTKGQVYFPKDFNRRSGLLRKRCEIRMIDEKGKTWSLAFRHRCNGRSYIAGWLPCHEANGLKVGDHVIFELLNSGQRPLMKFYSTRSIHA